MFKNLLEYEELQEACAEIFGFSGVTMLRDFGPLKKGQKLEGLWFDLEKSLVESFENNDGKPSISFQFRLEA